MHPVQDLKACIIRLYIPMSVHPHVRKAGIELGEGVKNITLSHTPSSPHQE